MLIVTYFIVAVVSTGQAYEKDEFVRFNLTRRGLISLSDGRLYSSCIYE